MALFVLLTFAIGHAVMLWVTLIQRLFVWLYARIRRDNEIREQDRRLLALVARQLLKHQYGMDPEQLDQDEWNALYTALGVPTPSDQRGSLAMVTSEAMGWCGLAAIPLGRGLWNPYYVAWCLILVIAGLFHDCTRDDAEVDSSLHGQGANRISRPSKAKLFLAAFAKSLLTQSPKQPSPVLFYSLRRVEGEERWFAKCYNALQIYSLCCILH
jgi:hypothetical protein